MFEDILKSLGAELEDLGAKRVKCEKLLEKVQDREKKAKLAVQHDRLRHATDRLKLCLDILGYNVSLEVSEDGRSIRFL